MYFSYFIFNAVIAVVQGNMWERELKDVTIMILLLLYLVEQHFS